MMIGRVLSALGLAVFWAVIGSASISAASVPEAPSDVKVTADGIIFDIEWRDNSTNETDFVIEFGIDGIFFISFPEWICPIYDRDRDVVRAIATVFLPVGREYLIRVYAVNSEGRSDAAYSERIYVPPDKGLYIYTSGMAKSDTEALCTITNVVEIVNVSYNIYKWEDRERRRTFVKNIHSFAADTNKIITFSDSGLEPGKTYSYETYMVANGWEFFWDSVTIYTPDHIRPPRPPYGFMKQDIGAESEFSWGDLEPEHTGFKIQKKTELTGKYVTLAVLGPEARSYRCAKETAHGQYSYRIIAFNDGGDSAPKELVFLNNSLPLATYVSNLNKSAVAGQIVYFDTIYADGDGYQDVNNCFLKITPPGYQVNSYAAMYDAAANKLYTYEYFNGADNPIGGFAPGSANILHNTNLSIDCSKTTVVKTGKCIAIRWAIRFNSGYQGEKTVYAYAMDPYDLQPLSMDYPQGSFTILATNPGNAAPRVITDVQLSGQQYAGEWLTYTAEYTDTDGYANISECMFMIDDGSADGFNGAFMYYDNRSNQICLFDDDSCRFIRSTRSGVVENAYCKVDCGATGVTSAGNKITINWRVSFKAPFVGIRYIYVKAIDGLCVESGPWQKLGTLTVKKNNAPQAAGVSPASGPYCKANEFVTINAVYSDPEGAGNLADCRLVINKSSAYGNSGVYLYYNQNENRIYMGSDSMSPLYGGGVPGTGGDVDSPYCTLSCAGTTVASSGNTLTVSWRVLFKDAFKGYKHMYAHAADDFGLDSGLWKDCGMLTIEGNSPDVGSTKVYKPIIGDGEWGGFEAAYSDPDGFADLAECRFMVSTSAGDGRNSAYIRYNQNENKIYLASDDLSVWQGGINPGFAGMLENSFCKVDCSRTLVAGNGDCIYIYVVMSFKTAFIGNKHIYLQAVDDLGLTSGPWKDKGTCTVDDPPQAGTVIEAGGTSAKDEWVTFTSTYIDINGFADLAMCRLLVSSASNEGTNCLNAYYNANGNTLYLGNDSLSVWQGGYEPGSANIMENSYCMLDCSNTTVERGGNEITVKWRVSFKRTFAGTKRLYLQAKDDLGYDSGPWKDCGAWTIGQDNPVQAVSVAPVNSYSLPGQWVTFLSVYSDPDGADDIAECRLLVKRISSEAMNSAYVIYNKKENKVYLASDDLSTRLGGFSPGTGGIVENSWCELDCSATAVTVESNRIIVNWRISFKAAFKGVKHMYVQALDIYDQTSGDWQDCGIWRDKPVNIAPDAVSFTGAPVVSEDWKIYTTVYADADGYGDLYKCFLQLGSMNASAVDVLYNQDENKLYIRGGFWGPYEGGITPGTGGVLENQFCRLDCAGTTVTAGGNILIVNWRISTKGPFSPQPSVTVSVLDELGVEPSCYRIAFGWVNNPGSSTVSPVNSGSSTYEWVTFTVDYVKLGEDSDFYEIMISDTLDLADGSRCLYAVYNRELGRFNLMGDNVGNPAPGILENLYCRLDCAGSTASANGNSVTIRWRVSFKDTFTGAKSIFLRSYYAGISVYPKEWARAGSWTLSCGHAPKVDDVFPANVLCYPDDWRTFTSTYSDIAGADDLESCRLLISQTSSNLIYAVHVKYEPAENKLYLASEDNLTWYGGIEPGEPGIIENSNCRIDCSKTNVTASGDAITVGWHMSFKETFTGVKTIYLWAEDKAGLTSGDWKDCGTWTMILAYAPETGAVTNPSGKTVVVETPNGECFTSTFSDKDGFKDLAVCQLQISDSWPGDGNRVMVKYNQDENKLYLANDDMSAWLGGATPGSNIWPENSYCTLYCNGTTISSSGNTITINWRLVLKNTIKGAKHIYLWAEDDSGLNSGYGKDCGTWTILENYTPTMTLLSSPERPALPNEEQVFEILYKDEGGINDMSSCTILFTGDSVNEMAPSAKACYSPALGTLYLDADGWMYGLNEKLYGHGYAVGSNIILENSLISIDCSKIQATRMDEKSLKIKWVIKFKKSFAGPRKVASFCIDSQGNQPYSFYYDWGILGDPAVCDIDNSGKADMAADFGPGLGIWIYLNGIEWKQLIPLSAKSITKCNFDNAGGDDLVIDFGPKYGIYALVNGSAGATSWYCVQPLTARNIIACNLDSTPADELVIDFGYRYGIYIFSADTREYTQLCQPSAKYMFKARLDADLRDDIVADFGADVGIYACYNGNPNSWKQVQRLSANDAIAAQLDDNMLDELVINFGPSYGVYVMNNNDNSKWTHMSDASPERIMKAALDADPRHDIVMDLGGGSGIYRIYNGDISSAKLLFMENGYRMVCADFDRSVDARDDLFIDLGESSGGYIVYNDDAAAFKRLF